jgi:hypothetical protein
MFQEKSRSMRAAFFRTSFGGYFGVVVGVVAGVVVVGRLAGAVAPVGFGLGAEGIAPAPVAAGLAVGGAGTPDCEL